MTTTKFTEGAVQQNHSQKASKLESKRETKKSKIGTNPPQPYITSADNRPPHSLLYSPRPPDKDHDKYQYIHVHVVTLTKQ